MSPTITIADITQFALKHPDRLFNMKIAGKSILAEYIRDKHQFGRDVSVIAFINCVVAYRRDVTEEVSLEQLHKDSWPIEKSLQWIYYKLSHTWFGSTIASLLENIAADAEHDLAWHIVQATRRDEAKRKAARKSRAA